MIVITGDSWGVGEWGYMAHLSGPGIGDYILLNDSVINLSSGGSSNTQSIHRLTQLLQKFQPDAQDKFYWIVTCPSRCCTMEDFISCPGTFLEFGQELLYQNLICANDLAQKHNITINLIGGLCDLQQVNTQEFNHLNIAVPSWGKLLHEDYVAGLLMPEWWHDLGEYLKKNQPSKMNDWLSVASDISQKYSSWADMKKTYFKSCGDHPDRTGHIVLRDHLFPEWKNRY